MKAKKTERNNMPANMIMQLRNYEYTWPKDSARNGKFSFYKDSGEPNKWKFDFCVFKTLSVTYDLDDWEFLRELADGILRVDKELNNGE